MTWRLPPDHYGAHGRFHHATWAVDSQDEVMRAADIALENGIKIETGPAQARGPADILSVSVSSPVAAVSRWHSAGARLMLAPDWQPVVWTEAERRRGRHGA